MDKRSVVGFNDCMNHCTVKCVTALNVRVMSPISRETLTNLAKGNRKIGRVCRQGDETARRGGKVFLFENLLSSGRCCINNLTIESQSAAILNCL